MLYPNKISKNHPKQTIHANRGMTLESMINDSNKYYLDNDVALIYKKPTPIGTVKVSYENNKKIIKKAYFKEQSTLDYNGIYRGKYIEFEAKETTSKTSFPLSNIHDHQIMTIRNVLHHGGICFIILSMNGLIYLIKGEDFIKYIDTNERKSVAYDYIKEVGRVIKIGYAPICDYLSIVDCVYNI